MTKIKSVLLLLLGALLALFLYENWVVTPYIKIFGKELIQLNISLIILIFIALGFFLGLFSHVTWVRQRQKKRLEQQAPQAQNPKQQEEKKQ